MMSSFRRSKSRRTRIVNLCAQVAHIATYSYLGISVRQEFLGNEEHGITTESSSPPHWHDDGCLGPHYAHCYKAKRSRRKGSRDFPQKKNNNIRNAIQ